MRLARSRCLAGTLVFLAASACSSSSGFSGTSTDIIVVSGGGLPQFNLLVDDPFSGPRTFSVPPQNATSPIFSVDVELDATNNGVTFSTTYGGAVSDTTCLVDPAAIANDNNVPQVAVGPNAAGAVEPVGILCQSGFVGAP